MKSWMGLDPSPAAVRWQARRAEDETLSRGVSYRLCGCPKSADYLSGETWGDPLALKEHCFASLGEALDKTGDYRFIEPNATDWMKGYFSGNSTACPPVDPQSVLTLAIPNATETRLQDAYLANLPLGYRKTYLLWRPVAIALSWLARKGDEEREAYEGRRVFVLDLDGGAPELAELKMRRHGRLRDWIVPVRRPARCTADLECASFDAAVLEAAFRACPEHRQLMAGQSAARMQELLESRETQGDLWVRAKGAWRHPTLEIPRMLDQTVLKFLNPLFKGLHLEADDVLLVNGWAARRFRRQFYAAFERFGCELEIVEADSVAHGACLFSQRIDLGLPTYYDIVPDYRLFDSARTMDWMVLFKNAGAEVEPGTQIASERFDSLVMKKFDDEVAVYVQNRDDAHRCFARRLTVSLARFAREDIPLSLTATVEIGRGAALLKFAMRDAGQEPVFLVDRKPSRTLEFRYTVERGGQISGVEEPEHRGFPNAQPVLGRLYDSDENVRMAEDWLQEWKNGMGNLGQVPRFVSYKQRYGVAAKEDLVLVRCGYSTPGESEPTRGLLGTKRLPNMPQIDELVERLAAVEPAGAAYWKWQNWCHSFASAAYKKRIRALLRTPRVGLTWTQAYAPGYVLGDEPEDFGLLLACILQPHHDAQVVPKLWWSVFRMLCWHPECRVTDVDLAEKVLWKLVNADVHTAANANDRKFFALAILYMLRVREAGEGETARDYSPGLLKALKGLFASGGALASVTTPKTMMGNYRPDGSFAEYVVRFIDRVETIKDRELGARLGGE